MPKPKGKRTQRKRRRLVSEDEEQKVIAKKLRDRYGRKTNEAETTTAFVQKADSAVVNPTKHNSTIQRCVQNYLNKLNTPEEPEKYLPRKWMCAFCGLQSCYGDLGDLFGPYYIAGATFPDFLPPTQNKMVTSKSSNKFSIEHDEVYSDVWFHGHCGLWTANLMFFAGKFPRLAEILQTCWHQRCKICKKPGASIPVDTQSTYVHYPCAVNKRYRMEPLTLRCRLPVSSHSGAH